MPSIPIQARALRALVVAALLGALLALAPASPPEATAQPARSDEADESDAPVQSDSGKDPWTILLYNVADTENIELDLLVDVEKLAEVGSTEDVNVITLIDRSPDQVDAPLLNVPNWETAKMFRVEQGELVELQDIGEVDMGDGNTLAWFLSTGMQQFPAERYAVFIDDHGGGVTGAGWDMSTEIATGEPSNLKLDEITEAVGAGLDAAGEDKVDLFGYLACLMATYDAAAQLAPYVDYLVASEELTYGPQADMSGMLATLTADPEGTTALELGSELVELTENLGDVLDFPERTQSVIDLGQMGLVTQALDAFATAVEAELPDMAPELGRALSAAPRFGAVGGAEPFPLYDLGALLVGLENVSPEVSIAADSLYNAMEGSIADVFNGELAQQATGMSIYFPPTADLYAERYPEVAGSAAWADMLQAYYGSPADIAEAGGSGELAFTSNDLTLDVDSTGVLATATMAEGGEDLAVGATFNGGVTFTDGTTGYFYSLGAVIGAGTTSDVAQAWDFSYLQLTDADGVVLDAYTTIEQTSTGFTASIPVLFQTADGTQFDAWLQISLDEGFTLTGDIALLGETDGGFAQLTPEPGDLIAPLILIADGGQYSYELISDAAVDATTVGLGVSALPSGTVFAASIEVYDAAGDIAVATATAPVP